MSDPKDSEGPRTGPGGGQGAELVDTPENTPGEQGEPPGAAGGDDEDRDVAGDSAQ